ARVNVTGDPCVDPAVGGAPTTVLTQQGTSLAATLGGNNSACFSRIQNGAFISLTGLVILCASPAQCAIALASNDPKSGKLTLTGAEATRFQQFFRVQQGVAFRSRGADSDPAVQIMCPSTSSCDIAIVTDRTQLPAVEGSNRVNP